MYLSLHPGVPQGAHLDMSGFIADQVGGGGGGGGAASFLTPPRLFFEKHHPRFFNKFFYVEKMILTAVKCPTEHRVPAEPTTYHYDTGMKTGKGGYQKDYPPLYGRETAQVFDTKL